MKVGDPCTNYFCMVSGFSSLFFDNRVTAHNDNNNRSYFYQCTFVLNLRSNITARVLNSISGATRDFSIFKAATCSTTTLVVFSSFRASFSNSCF